MLHRLLLAVAGSGGFESKLAYLPVVNVESYGAVHDGSTDDATAINNAINALPTTGGIVYFPAGDYAIGSTISLGDGSSSAVSTRHGIQLMSPRGGPWGVLSMSPTGYGAARLKWIGSTNGTMVSIKGPVLGCGIDGLTLDANSSSGTTALLLTSAQFGHFPDMTILRVTGAPAIKETVVSTTNTQGNLWGSIRMFLVPANGTRGVVFTGTTSANSCYERFQDLNIAMTAGLSSGTVHAIDFAACDNISIDHFHWSSPTVTGGTLVVAYFDYSIQSAWPADCRLESVDFGASTMYTAVAANNGSPSASAAENRVVSISATNSSGTPPSNPSLTNLAWGYTSANP